MKFNITQKQTTHLCVCLDTSA